MKKMLLEYQKGGNLGKKMFYQTKLGFDFDEESTFLKIQAMV